MRKLKKGRDSNMNIMIYKILMIAIGILLLAAGIVDIRKKQISRGMILALLLLCFAVIPFKEDYGIYDAVGGLAIGACAIGVSVVSREQIGRGDGMVIAAIGLVLGAYSCIAVVCVASMIMCVVSIVVLISKTGTKQTRLPFLPAVFVGYALYTSRILL